MNPPPAAETAIPRRSMLWLSIALVFTIPPLFGALAAWVPALFIGMLVVKFVMELRGLRLRSAFLQAAISGSALGGVWLTYHALIGLESGISISLLLIGVKILDSHTPRDFHLLAVLGWFLCLTELFISQEFLAVLYALAGFFLICVAVVQFHRGQTSSRPIAAPLRITGGLLLRALPVVAILFLLFPRGNGGLRFDLKHAFQGRSGMSDSLKPGSVSKLALSNEVAFRAEFPDGATPPPSAMYWRGAVLTQDNGMSWGLAEGEVPSRPIEHPSGPAMRQSIVIQPNGSQWIFALDWPTEAPHGTRLIAGNVVRANQPIYSPRRYEVTSHLTPHTSDISDRERKACLAVPEDISPRVRALVLGWIRSSSDHRAVMARALDFFRTSNFRYTLSPGDYGNHALDEFLFHRKAGFCEHYAAAFGTLMRLAGIPSRVVMGYQGGEFNTFGSYVVVRQSDAHAWCEVWLPPSGWQRIDPTAVVMPDRVSLGSAYNDLYSAAAGAAGTTTGPVTGAWNKSPILRNLRLAWDSITYEWDSRVANFDEDAQQSLLLDLGLVDNRPFMLVLRLIGAGALLFAVQLAWTWWRSRPSNDRLKELYARFCQRAAAVGAVREAWEGPSSFALRAAALLPAQAGRIRRVIDLYVALRYSPTPAGSATAELEREVAAFCREATKS